MKKIVSQIAGAVAVVTASTLAFAQTNNSATTNPATPIRTSDLDKAPKDVDLKSSESGSRFGPGANNGAVYNSAVRSTDIKAGNVSSVDDPAPVRSTTTTTTAAPATPAPAPAVAPAPVDTTPAYTPAPAPMPAPAAMPADTAPARPARADRG